MFGVFRFRSVYWQIALILALVLQAACSLKTPEAKSPPPNDQNQDKNFFVQGVSVNGAAAQKGRTFQCAWAPISESGYLAEWFLTHGAITTEHCNIEWRIEENYLLGKKVDPSVDPKDWKTIISIPITSHFKYVHDKDDKGRDRKDYIEKTNEDHWSQRPFMKLDLSGIRVHDWAYDVFGGLGQMGGMQVLAVEDVLWTQDKGRKYWAFTLTVSSPLFGSDLQAKIRFNFLEFQHKENFAITPYNDENSKYLNILHVLGKKFDSETQALYNARWDISGGDHSVEVCSFGVPKNYKSMLNDVVEEWNDEFQKIGQPRAFWLNKERQLDYPLDLRCPTIVWVNDKRVIRNSPLGIGLLNADVKNGEALWGSIIIYGAAFERYAKAFSPSDFAAAQTDENPMPIKTTMESPFTFARNPEFFVSNERMQGYGSQRTQSDLFNVVLQNELRAYPEFELLESIASISNHEARSASIQRFLDGYAKDATQKDAAEKFISQQFANVSNKSERAMRFLAFRNNQSPDEVYRNIERTSQLLQGAAVSRANGDKSMSESLFQSKPMQQIMMGSFASNAPLSPKDQKMMADMANMQTGQRSKYVYNSLSKEITAQMHRPLWDLDNTFADAAPGWHSVSADVLNKRSFADRLMSMLKKTVAHEYGHFLGLGHNFKENILPRPHTVPAKYFDFTKANTEKYNSALTTVMGYDDPSVEVGIEYNDIKPGPHDTLALRYIYNREYSTWNGSDPDFRYAKLPNDGRIPESDPRDDSYKTTYFPQCNDFHATLALDPYCMRHDSGYDAKTLVKNYFDYLDKNWIANLNNFANSSNSAEWALYRWMWMRSFSTFAKVRHFYDYMISKYRDELMQISVKEENLMSFYKTCSGQEENAEVAAILRRADPELTELCQVNGEVIAGIQKYLEEPGPDFSEIDNSNWYVSSSVTGGDVDLNYSHMDGTWSRLGVLPVKYAALLTLTSPYPYIYSFPGWVVPLFQYGRAGKDYANLYATFYPEQFTEAISATVRKNLRFKNNGDSSNNMGRSVLALGWFLDNLYMSNEVHRDVPLEYMDNIRRQTKFNLNRETGGYVAIVVKGVKRKGDTAEADRVVGFNATMYDFASREMVPLAVAYVLPDAKIIFNTPDQKSFIYPVSELNFYSDDSAYALAVRVTFTEDEKSSLWTRSAKVELRQKYNDALNSCLIGTERSGVKNGIQDYFNASNKDFRGFKVLPDIADSAARFQIFKDSIDEEFKKYWADERYAKIGNMPDPNACKSALEGIGLVVTSSIAIQGYWLPEIYDYIIK